MTTDAQQAVEQQPTQPTDTPEKPKVNFLQLLVAPDNFMEYINDLTDDELKEVMGSISEKTAEKVDGIFLRVKALEAQAENHADTAKLFADRSKRYKNAALRLRNWAMYAMDAAQVLEIDGFQFRLSIKETECVEITHQDRITPEMFLTISEKAPDAIEREYCWAKKGIKEYLEAFPDGGILAGYCKIGKNRKADWKPLDRERLSTKTKKK